MRAAKGARCRGPRAALLAAAALLALPGGAAAEERLVAVTSFTILADFVANVGGDAVEARSLTPRGAEVHEWELKPRNFQDLEEADVVFYNGYGLEQWLGQLRDTVREGVPVIAVAEETGVETLPIRIGDFEGDPDPHLWMDPEAAIAYVEVIRDRLIELDPDNEEAYRDNTRAYVRDLETMKIEVEAQLRGVAPDQRVLITSEAAFLYFARRFDFEHDGIWGSNAEEEASPRQVMRIIDRIEEARPRAIFWESTISDRYVRSVADDTGVRVAGPLYVDSLADYGSPAGDYIGMMKHNARYIRDALGPR